MDDTVWLRCSACKKDIRYGATHWVCSVSTCNRSRTKLVFCSVLCWDSHVAFLRHRDSWAVEARAPSREAWAAEMAAEEAAGGPATRQPPVRSISPAAVTRPAPAPAPAPGPLVRPAPAPVAAAAPSAKPITPDQPAPRPPGAAAPAPAPAPAAEPRRIVAAAPAPAPAASDAPFPAPTGQYEREILIVVSKMKKYIKDRSGMNCSDSVAEALSDHVRLICDDAIRAAGTDGRKTVLDRDVPRTRR